MSRHSTPCVYQPDDIVIAVVDSGLSDTVTLHCHTRRLTLGLTDPTETWR